MDSKALSLKPSRIKVRDMVTTALLISMVFVATSFINIRLPISINGGLVHLGTAMLFICSMVFGKKKGAAAGAFGMFLFDIFSIWAAWAPFTFIVRGVMGYIVGFIANLKGKAGRSFVFNILAIVAGGVWMIIGYYLTEVILYGNWISPVTAVPGNVLQILIGLVSLPIVPVLKRLKL